MNGTVCYLIDDELVERPVFATPGSPRPILPEARSPRLRWDDPGALSPLLPVTYVEWYLLIAWPNADGGWSALYRLAR